MKAAHAVVSPEQRHQMIEVAAYYRAARRNFSPGDELTDWVEAEAEVDQLLAAAPPAEAEPQELAEIQEGMPRSIARQDALERMVRQHPQRDEPRVDSVEPDERLGA